MKKLISYAALAAAAIALGVSGADAATATGNLSVTATVQAACTLGSLPVAFGQIAPNTLVKNSGGAVIVNCASTTPYTVALSSGQNGTPSNRNMIGALSSSNRIPYNLYSD